MTTTTTHICIKIHNIQYIFHISYQPKTYNIPISIYPKRYIWVDICVYILDLGTQTSTRNTSFAYSISYQPKTYINLCIIYIYIYVTLSTQHISPLIYTQNTYQPTSQVINISNPPHMQQQNRKQQHKKNTNNTANARNSNTAWLDYNCKRC